MTIDPETDWPLTRLAVHSGPRRARIKPWTGLLLVASVLLVSCAEPTTGNAGRFEPRQLDIPAGGYNHLAWLAGDRIVAEYESDVSKFPDFRFSAFRSDGRDFHALPLGEDDQCRLTRYSLPQRLPDGHLGFTKECLDPAGSDIDSTVTYLAYDLDKDRTEELAPIVPTGGRRRIDGKLFGDMNPEQVAWAPDLSRAIISTGGLCGTLAALTSRGVSDLPIEISDGKRSWRLEEQLHAEGSDSCTTRGRASYPTWSRENEIAFFASPQTVGLAGAARANQPANLYLMDAKALKPRMVLSDVKSPTSLEWSPNGRWLAFAAGAADEGALWLFDASTKAAEHVMKGSFARVTWAPDGRQLAVVQNLEEGEDDIIPASKVSIVNVTDLLRQ